MKIRDVVDAIRKNGYPQLRNQYEGWAWSEEKGMSVKAGCAVGQAAMNLGMLPNVLGDALSEIHFTGTDTLERQLAGTIFGLNDDEYLPLPEIADRLEELVPPEVMERELSFSE